ncbi:MAG: B-box zinc finger protein [Candidatus Acidiferrales bacterium]
MNCAVHPDAEATGYCRNCGKAMCPECIREVRGVRYCEPCLAAMVAHPQSRAERDHHEHHAWAAFGLGFIPGLGAVYNGEYTKALVHVAIFIGLVTLDSTGAREPLYGLMTAFFCVYMPIEAFLTARRKAELNSSSAPLPVPEAGAPSAATESAETAPAMERPRHFPVGAIVLIVIGGAFLLDTLGWLDMDRVLDVGWPVILIAIGGYLMWKRTRRTA